MKKIKKKISVKDSDFNHVIISCERSALGKEQDKEKVTKSLTIVMQLFPALSENSKAVILRDVKEHLGNPVMWGLKDEFKGIAEEFYQKIQTPLADNVSYVNVEVDSEEFGLICYEAVKYAVGRQTYMPSIVCSFVTPYLSLMDKKYLKEIKLLLDNTTNFGDPAIDGPIWASFRKPLDKVLENADE